MSADLAAEDHCDFIEFPDCAIGVEQALTEFVERGTAIKDEIVAKFDLREEQAMLAAGLCSFLGGEERGEASQPLLAACQQVAGRQRLSELLEALRRCILDESVCALFEGDALLAHPVGQPVMLIETDSSRERKVGTKTDEHPSPPLVIDLEIVLSDPAIGDLKMPSVRLAVADRGENARRFAGLHLGEDAAACGEVGGAKKESPTQ